jgi:hypothetical protein
MDRFWLFGAPDRLSYHRVFCWAKAAATTMANTAVSFCTYSCFRRMGLSPAQLLLTLFKTLAPEVKSQHRAPQEWACLLVWFGFKTVSHPPPDFSFSVPEGWTLEQVAMALAQQDASNVNLSALTVAERSAELEPRELRTGTVLKALQSLRDLARTTQIRRYTVTYEAPTYTFRV